MEKNNEKELIKKINDGNNSAFRKLYGSDAEVLKKQAKRYTSLIEKFKSSFGPNELVLFSSPVVPRLAGIIRIIITDVYSQVQLTLTMLLLRLLIIQML